MKRLILFAAVAATALSAGCSGINSVGYNRFDRGRSISKIAVLAHNQTTADRYKMWAWTKSRPRIVPADTFAEDIASILANGTNCPIVPKEELDAALTKLGLQGRMVLSKHELRQVRELTGADAVLFGEISFYLQNYLFWKTFGLVEISMRLVGTTDGSLLWDAKGRNFALFITTDRAIEKTRDKMLASAAAKLQLDRGVR